MLCTGCSLDRFPLNGPSSGTFPASEVEAQAGVLSAYKSIANMQRQYSPYNRFFDNITDVACFRENHAKATIYKDDLGKEYETTEIPADMMELAQEWREKLVESVCETDEELMMMYLEGEEPSVDELKAVLRKATCECTAVPVCCPAAFG